MVDPNLDLANKRIRDLQQGELCSDPLCDAAWMQAWLLPGAALHSSIPCSLAQSGMRISAVRNGIPGTTQEATFKEGKLTAPSAVYSLTSSTSTDRIHVSLGTWASCSLIMHGNPSVQAGHSLHHAAPLGAGQHGNKWQDTKAFKTYQEMLQSEQGKPDAAFIGVPPQFHGGLSDKDNIEVSSPCCPAMPCHLHAPYVAPQCCCFHVAASAALHLLPTFQNKPGMLQPQDCCALHCSSS